MLLDDLIEGVTEALGRTPSPEFRPAVEQIEHILEYGQRWVLTPGVVRLAAELAAGCR